MGNGDINETKAFFRPLRISLIYSIPRLTSSIFETTNSAIEDAVDVIDDALTLRFLMSLRPFWRETERRGA